MCSKFRHRTPFDIMIRHTPLTSLSTVLWWLFFFKKNSFEQKLIRSYRKNPSQRSIFSEKWVNFSDFLSHFFKHVYTSYTQLKDLVIETAKENKKTREKGEKIMR